MSLSRLERMQEMAEEERIAKLRAKTKLETTDETKRKAKTMEEEHETTRFSMKGTRVSNRLWAPFRNASY